MIARMPLQWISSGINGVLTGFVKSIVNSFRSSVKRNKNTPTRTSVTGNSSGLNGTVVSTGRAAGMLGFDYSFHVPVGGFRPKSGARAFAMEKPEGIVFRSRTYSRFSGMLISRPGTHSDAERNQISSPVGRRRQKSMNDALAWQIAAAIADGYKFQLQGIPNVRTTVTTSFKPHLTY